MQLNFDDRLFHRHYARKLGKKPAIHDPKTVKLGPLLEKHLAVVPAAASYADENTKFPMWLNDSLGCCTQVSVASAIYIMTLNAQAPVLLGVNDVLVNYETSGYDPTKVDADGNNPTDEGDNEVAVLNRWVTAGYQRPGQTRDYLTGYGYVNPKNHDNAKRAIALCGGLYTGLALPKTALADGDWVVVPNAVIAGGHAVYVHGYDADWLYLNTWGERRRMSWGFFDTYCDEAYGLLSRENWLGVHGITPMGEAFVALSDELAAAMAG
ncbi:MAG: hypothetical protein ACRYGR_06970 [Janthinobacterium lividum]